MAELRNKVRFWTKVVVTNIVALAIVVALVSYFNVGLRSSWFAPSLFAFAVLLLVGLVSLIALVVRAIQYSKNRQ